MLQKKLTFLLTYVLNFYPSKSCFRILISIWNLNQYLESQCQYCKSLHKKVKYLQKMKIMPYLCSQFWQQITYIQKRRGHQIFDTTWTLDIGPGNRVSQTNTIETKWLWGVQRLFIKSWCLVASAGLEIWVLTSFDSTVL